MKADKSAENYGEYRKGKKNDEIWRRKKIGSHLLFQQIPALECFPRHNRVLVVFISLEPGEKRVPC
jgi:hypothetical protein